MKKNYEKPYVEVIEMEIEGAILALSDVPSGTKFDDVEEGTGF